MSERTLLNKVKKLNELEAQQKELEKQISAVQAEIKAEMTRQEHSKFYKRYCKEMETRRFTVA